MRRTARALGFAAAALLLLAGAVVAAAAFIPAERVAAAAADRAESVLGAPVRIESASIRFFPLPGVDLEGLAVGAADSTAFARVDAAELRARILPLFRGRVVVTRLRLERPRLMLEVDSTGTLTLPIARDPGPPEPRAGRDIAFAIDEIAVGNGRIGYRDLRDGRVVRLDGWSQQLQLTGQVQDGRLARISMSGELEIRDVDARLPDVVLPPRDLRLALEHDATLDLETDRLELRTLAVTLNGLTLTGSGTVRGASGSTRRLDLALAAEGLQAGTLLDLAPDSLRARLTLPDGTPLRLEGVAGVRATVVGPLSTDSLPAVDGRLQLENGSVVAAGETLLDQVAGEAVFALDSLSARFRGRALGETFQLGLAVRDPGSPIALIALSGRADLGRLAELGLIADSLGVDGDLDVDLRTRLPLRDPSAALATGTLRLAGVEAPGIGPGLAVPSAVLRLDGDELRVQPLRVEIGTDRATVTADLTARGWIPALLDSMAPPARIVAVVEADTLDLDALLGPSESTYPPLLFARLRDRPLDGRSAAALAEEAGLAVPALPTVDARVTVSAPLVVRNGLRYSDVDAVLHLRPESVEVERARFGLMGGTVELAGRLSPTDIDSAGRPIASRLTGRYSLVGVGAEPFFDRLTPFREHLTGRLDLAGSVAMALDRHALPERPAVTSDGTMAIADGRLMNWRVLQAVMERLELPAYDTVRFRDWAGRFAVNGPMVTLDETVLRGDDLDARAAGSLDLGGRLDLGATLYLSAALADRAGAVGREVIAAAATDGRVPVGVSLNGPVENPRVSLDLSAARAAVVDRARTAAREEARRAADRVEREVADRVAAEIELPDSLRGLPPDSLRAVLGDSLFGLLPDSLTLPRDSLAERAEDELEKRLRKLWPGGGG